MALKSSQQQKLFEAGLALSETFLAEGNIMLAAKSLQGLCQSNLLPVNEVEARLRLAQLLLTRIERSEQAISHLKRVVRRAGRTA